MLSRIVRTKSTGLGFSPRTIAGLALWLDASDAAILGSASTGPGSVSNNGPVKYWGDKSGSSMNLTNSGADSVCPTYKAASQNNLAVLGFDGGDRIFTTSSSTLNTSTKTAFVVSRRTGGSGEQCIFDRANAFALTVKSAGGYLFYYTDGVTGSRTIYIGAFASTDSNAAYSVVCVRQAGTSCAAWVNGTSQSISQTTSGTSLDGGNFAVGSVGASSSLLFTGNVAEMLIYTSALTDAQRQFVQRYLGYKWGVSVA